MFVGSEDINKIMILDGAFPAICYFPAILPQLDGAFPVTYPKTYWQG